MIEKEKREWMKAFNTSKKMTGISDIGMKFKNIENQKQDTQIIAEYMKSTITVNKKILSEKIPKGIKLMTLIHEDGHHVDDKVYPLIHLLTFGLSSIIYLILNEKDKLEEFIADKFLYFILKKEFGNRKGKEKYDEYIKYFSED